MEIPSQGRHFPGIHGPKTVKSSSKHFVNGPGHGVVFGGATVVPPKRSWSCKFAPWKVTRRPQQESTVCSLRWFLRHQRNAQTPTVGNLKHPLGISRNSAANRSDISCDACAWCTACSVKIQRRVWAPKRIWRKSYETSNLPWHKQGLPQGGPPTTVDGSEILLTSWGW